MDSVRDLCYGVKGRAIDMAQPKGTERPVDPARVSYFRRKGKGRRGPQRNGKTGRPGSSRSDVTSHLQTAGIVSSIRYQSLGFWRRSLTGFFLCFPRSAEQARLDASWVGFGGWLGHCRSDLAGRAMGRGRKRSEGMRQATHHSDTFIQSSIQIRSAAAAGRVPLSHEGHRTRASCRHG